MAIINVVHTFKLFTYYLTIPLYALGFSGWRVSVGFWCRFTQDTLAPQRPGQSSGGSLHSYTYRKLDTDEANIRLLRLEPGAYHDPLVGHLNEVSLDEAECKYISLSYVWGGVPSQLNTLYIEGMCMAITDNLDKALRRVRSRTATKALWVDAVCIDQANVEEKQNQIPLMARVYSGAETVLSWLGEATQYSVTGMEVLSYLVSDEPFNDNSPWNRLDPGEIALGLDDILQRVYFQRIWIVQEAALARRLNLQTGDHSIQWQDTDAFRFLMRIKLLEVSPAWQTEKFKGIDLRSLRELLEQSVANRDRNAGISRSATLLDLVHMMRHMKSADPRDKIYGLIGLASPADVADFSPDYMETWEGTYKRFCDHAYRLALQHPSKEWEKS